MIIRVSSQDRPRPAVTVAMPLFAMVAAAAIAAAGWLLCLGPTTRPAFVFDDSYITLANALALHGTSKFASPPLSGSTSIVHVLLVALLTLIMPAESALAASNLLATAAYALGIMRLAAAFGLRPPTALLFAVLGCSGGYTALHLFNGLETGLALAAIVWSIDFFVRGDRRRLALAAGILPCIRPELGVWSVIALAFDWRARRAQGEPRRALLATVAVAMAGALPFLLAAWLAAGSPIPDTIAAKKWFFAEDCNDIEWRAATIFGALGPWAAGLGAIAFGALAMPMSRLGRGALLFAAIFFLALWINLPGAAGHNECRYLYVFVPFLLAALMQLLGRIDIGDRMRLALTAIMLVPALAVNLPTAVLRAGELRAFTEEHRYPVAAWLDANTPTGARIMLHDAGYPGYAAHRQLIDFIGLKSPQNIAMHREITHRSCGEDRAAAIAAIMRSSHPDYLVLLNAWDAIYGFSAGLAQQGIVLRTVRADPAGYSIYRVPPL